MSRSIILTASIRPPQLSPPMALEREHQISYGLARFLRAASGMFPQIVFVENTMNEASLKRCLAPLRALWEFQVIPASSNDGVLNKGAGMVSMIRMGLAQVTGDRVVHFEPRNLIVPDCQLLSKEYAGNVFKLDCAQAFGLLRLPFYYRHFQTHLFQMESNLAREYFSLGTQDRLSATGASVERDLYQWMQSRSVKYTRLAKMGILWHERSSDRFLPI